MFLNKTINLILLITRKSCAFRSSIKSTEKSSDSLFNVPHYVAKQDVFSSTQRALQYLHCSLLQSCFLECKWNESNILANLLRVRYHHRSYEREKENERKIIYVRSSLSKIECIGNHSRSVTRNNGLGEGDSLGAVTCRAAPSPRISRRGSRVVDDRSGKMRIISRHLENTAR